MKTEELTETPQFVLPTNFNLDDESFNRRFAKKLLKKSNRRVVYSINDDIHLYEYGSGYALIDIKSMLILYYVKYEVKKYNALNITTAQQVILWRNQANTYTVNIAKKIFFEFIIPKFGAIITDALQTNEGQRFWLNRIGDAFNEGLYVYFVELISPRIIRKLDRDEIPVIVKDAWGNQQKYQSKRIVITDHQL